MKLENILSIWRSISRKNYTMRWLSIRKLCSSIWRIIFDGTNSNVCDFSYEWLFNNKQNFRFPNWKCLILIRCQLNQLAVEYLSRLIENQLDELTLTFDKQIFNNTSAVEENSLFHRPEGNCSFVKKQCSIDKPFFYYANIIVLTWRVTFVMNLFLKKLLSTNTV